MKRFICCLTLVLAASLSHAEKIKVAITAKVCPEVGDEVRYRLNGEFAALPGVTVLPSVAGADYHVHVTMICGNARAYTLVYALARPMTKLFDPTVAGSAWNRQIAGAGLQATQRLAVQNAVTAVAGNQEVYLRSKAYMALHTQLDTACKELAEDAFFAMAAGMADNAGPNGPNGLNGLNSIAESTATVVRGSVINRSSKPVLVLTGDEDAGPPRSHLLLPGRRTPALVDIEAVKGSATNISAYTGWWKIRDNTAAIITDAPDGSLVINAPGAVKVADSHFGTVVSVPDAVPYGQVP